MFVRLITPGRYQLSCDSASTGRVWTGTYLTQVCQPRSQRGHLIIVCHPYLYLLHYIFQKSGHETRLSLTSRLSWQLFNWHRNFGHHNVFVFFVIFILLFSPPHLHRKNVFWDQFFLVKIWPNGHHISIRFIDIDIKQKIWVWFKKKFLSKTKKI